MKEALALSRDERELLLAVAVTEQDRIWDRFEAGMGITWDIATLAGIEPDRGGKDGKPQKLPSQVKIPMLMAVAPEFFKAISDSYKGKYKAMLEAQRISGRGPVVDLGTLSPVQAREFYKRIGSMVAATPPSAEPPAEE